MRGTTLLEALVALAVTALVLTALGGVVVRANEARARATATADRLAAGRSIVVRLGGELEAARAAGVTIVAPPAGGPADWWTLRLVTTARDPFPGGVPGGDVRRVEYRVETDPAAAGTGVLVRGETAWPVPEGYPARGVPLVGGVRGFRIRAFDGGQWRSAWPAGPLPRAVEVRLALDGERAGEELTTAVALPLSRGRP